MRCVTAAPKGRIGAALGLALGMWPVAANERGLPFVADLQNWLLGSAKQSAEPAQQPQRRTTVDPAAIPPPSRRRARLCGAG
jgi:hypothetical protein